MSKLDDVSWHIGSEGFPSNLNEESAATHIGFFVTWMIRNGHWGEFLGTKAEAKVAAIKDGHISGRDLVLEECDGKLLTEMLKTEIVPFAQDYYEKRYMRDYQRTLATGLASDYLVEDSEPNYQRIAEAIGQRHAGWLTKPTRPKWRFW